MRIIILVLLTVIAYRHTLYYGYVSDDANVRKNTDDKKRPRTWWLLLKETYIGRSYWNEKDDKRERIKSLHDKLKESPGTAAEIASGIRAILAEPELNRPAHAMVIALHCLTVIGVYIAFGRTPGSFLAAVIFSIFPANYEGSLWLSGKIYSSTAALCLLGWAFPPFMPFIAALPRMLSVIAVSFPLVFLAAPGWTKVCALLVFPILWAKLPQLRLSNAQCDMKLNTFKENKEAWKISPLKIIIWLKFYGFYILNGITARHLTFKHPYLFFYAKTSKHTRLAYRKIDAPLLVALAAIGTIAAGFVTGGILSNPFFFGLFWFTVCIAPFCNFVMVGNQYTTSRYSYLANAGLCFMLASVMRAYPGAIVLLGWYAARLFAVSKGYKSDFWMDEFLIIEEPTFAFAWNNHGIQMLQRGNPLAALQDFTEAVNCDDSYFDAHFNLSGVYLHIKNINMAVFSLENARKCELMGQEEEKNKLIRDRERLIAALFTAQEKGNPVTIGIDKIPMRS
jgi:tetratricopeptide (TPR) repeat protein